MKALWAHRGGRNTHEKNMGLGRKSKHIYMMIAAVCIGNESRVGVRRQDWD